MRMPAPVVIDPGMAEPPRELATALVDACSQAATGTECRLVRDAPSGPYSAIAIVTWEEGDKARVEVGVRRDPISEWRTRELTFQSGDVELERFRTVGFVIGSLATAPHDETAKPTTVLPEAGKPPVVAKPPAAPKSSREPKPASAPSPVPVIVASEPPAQGRTKAELSRGWIGLVGTIGGGLDHGPARYGGRFGAGIRIVPHLAAIVSAGASVRGRDAQGMTAQWLDAGCGLNVAIFPPASHHLELRGEVIVEQFSAEAEKNNEHDSRLRTAAAARVGADGVLAVAAPLSLFAGVETTFRSATIVHVGGVNAGATRYVEFGAVLGARLEL